MITVFSARDYMERQANDGAMLLVVRKRERERWGESLFVAGKEKLVPRGWKVAEWEFATP